MLSGRSSGKYQSENDDIEYNIAFPNASSDETEAVVFLLGWAGAEDRHLAKYSNIYEKQGCITIRYVHPVSKVFGHDPSDSSEHKETARKLLALLDDYDLVENPVFVHAFSNGGYFVYRFLADEFQKNEVNVVGAIFDSCPSKLEYLVATRGLLYSGVLPNMFVSILCIFVFTFLYMWVKLKILLGLTDGPLMYEAMQDSPFHSWPHLFLYSSADVIVPLRHIEDMALAREKAGATLVVKHNFETSPHVLHLKQYPELYTEKCLSFVEECLHIYDGEEMPLEDGEIPDSNL
uniref:transmembrane protein 53 isoform X1 n=1 Tax=Ciona intestinalis TaxID=7719 RepID=UPI00005231EB|nr:transmembrane protein 53 isoform X1 [Ciona intestinalis]|eukprot:XP_002127410.1 transmembrane protein 53 isoform X1 [Ciona intestinalis]